MRKVNSIDKTGKVLFVDDKGTGTTIGTKTDCNAYGYDYNGNFCYAFKTQKDDNKDDNIVQGFGNSLSGKLHNVNGNGNEVLAGSNANVLGNNNLVHANASNSVTLGKGNYTEHYGELAYSASVNNNRAKISTLQYDGKTTNATPTELYIGNEVGQRLYINESYETAFFIKISSVSINAVNNTCAQNEQYIQFRYANNTLTATASQTIINNLGDVTLAIALDAVASTPDYIRVKITGRASEVFYHNVKLDITVRI